MLGLGAKIGAIKQHVFDPRTLSDVDLKLWLRHSVGIIESRWADSSAHGNNAVQSEEELQATPNGGGLDFNAGAENSYTFTGIECAAQEGFIVFMVIEPDAVSNATLLGIGGTSEFLEIHTAKKLRLRIDSDTDIITFVSNQFIADEKHIITLQREAGATGNINVWKNGILLTPTSQEANPGAITFNTLGDGGGRRFYDGHMYEVLVFDSADMTTTQITQVHNYLLQKHGL